jgi:hypothetical protein
MKIPFASRFFGSMRMKVFHVEHGFSGIVGRDAFPKRPRGRISVSIDTAFACGPFGERSLPQAKILLDMDMMQLEFFQWLMTPCPFVRLDGGRIVLQFGFLMTRHFSSRSTAKNAVRPLCPIRRWCANCLSRWHFTMNKVDGGVELALVMPDHLHALISFRWDPGNGMMNLIRAWKRHTSRHCGIAWQRDYFDHRIRNEEDHQSTWFYIRENPVRASLVASYEEWPHVWRPGHGMGW